MSISDLFQTERWLWTDLNLKAAFIMGLLDYGCLTKSGFRQVLAPI
jgi:hypothetical protein